MNAVLRALALGALILCCSCATEKPHQFTTTLPTCVASVQRDSAGRVIDVTPAANCHKGGGPGSNLVLFVTGPGGARERLRENSEYIVFGEGTTTCYGPPIPSPPVCVCTRMPCP
jgi:hypothetical protein